MCIAPCGMINVTYRGRNSLGTQWLVYSDFEHVSLRRTRFIMSWQGHGITRDKWLDYILWFGYLCRFAAQHSNDGFFQGFYSNNTWTAFIGSSSGPHAFRFPIFAIFISSIEKHYTGPSVVGNYI